MKKVWSALAILLVAVLGALYFKHEGVQQERQRRTADSLHTAQELLASQSRAALAFRDSVATVERQRQAFIHGQQAALEAANRALRTNSASFRGMLADSLRIGFDSLEAAHRAVEANLGSQRDSALAGWALAAQARDTLAALLRASQAQTQALSVALVQAQKVPFWSRPSVRIGMLAGAFLLGRFGR